MTAGAVGVSLVAALLSTAFAVFPRVARALVVAGTALRPGPAAARIILATGKILPGLAAGIVMVAGVANGAAVAKAGACCAINVDAKPVLGRDEAPVSRFGAGLTRPARSSAAGVVVRWDAAEAAGAAIETVME